MEMTAGLAKKFSEIQTQLLRIQQLLDAHGVQLDSLWRRVRELEEKINKEEPDNEQDIY